MVEVGSSNLPATTTFKVKLINKKKYNLSYNVVDLNFKFFFMKSFLALLTLSFVLFGCSSLTIEDASSSNDETQRILDMGLSLDESLLEAKKLDTPHLVSVVSLQLKNAISDKIQADKDLQESKKFERMVIVSENGSKLVSGKIKELIKDGFLATDVDELNYFIEGSRNLNSDSISHTLFISLIYNSKNMRNYFSVDFCDRWNNCELESQEIIAKSSGAYNCSSSSCYYEEEIEIKMTDELLRNTLENGFLMRLISEKKTSKVKISKPYLMGYLRVTE